MDGVPGFFGALVGIENNYKTSYILAGIMAALAGHIAWII